MAKSKKSNKKGEKQDEDEDEEEPKTIQVNSALNPHATTARERKWLKRTPEENKRLNDDLEAAKGDQE